MRSKWILLALLSLAPSTAMAQDDDGPSPVGVSDEVRAQLEAQQARARELMGELEDRMFKLSETLRGGQPDDAARLVLGLRKAREELILEDMREIEELLESGHYAKAAERQREVIGRLTELRDLLLSTDLDLLLKLERLRQMNQVLADLEALEAEQAEIQAMTDEIDATEGNGKEEAAETAELAQGDAAEEAEDLQEDVEEAAGEDSEASEAMEEASEEMEKAQQELAERDSSEASERQGKARKKLTQAKQQMEKQRKDLLWDIQPAIRRQVIDSLTRMRDELDRIQGDVGAAIGESAEPVALDPSSCRGLHDRLHTVIDIARTTQDLIRETEYSVYMDDMLDWTTLRLGPLERGLAEVSAGPLELSGCHRVHGVVEEMLEGILEEDRRMRSARGDDRTQKIIKLVSELKGVLPLQRVLREDTEQVASGEPGGGLAAATPEEIAHLFRLEHQVSEILLELDSRYMDQVQEFSDD